MVERNINRRKNSTGLINITELLRHHDIAPYQVDYLKLAINDHTIITNIYIVKTNVRAVIPTPFLEYHNLKSTETINVELLGYKHKEHGTVTIEEQ